MTHYKRLLSDISKVVYRLCTKHMTPWLIKINHFVAGSFAFS